MHPSHLTFSGHPSLGAKQTLCPPPIERCDRPSWRGTASFNDAFTSIAGLAPRPNSISVPQRLDGGLEEFIKRLFFAIACIAISACSRDVTRREKTDAQVVPIPPDAIVLRVEVKAVEYTDGFDPSQCDGARVCVPQYFWYRYHARVSERFSGEWQQQDVSFVHSQHAEFDRKRTHNCYVVLVPADNLEAQVKVDFIASGIYSHGDWKYDAASRTLLER